MTLEEYNRILIEKNNAVNLTGHKTIEKSWEYNILDSLLFADVFDECENICDIGCGAGLPSVPLAIKFPNKKWTLIDSTKKKIDFINDLKIPNVRAVWTRIESFDETGFDAVTARGVAPLKDLIKYAMPKLKKGGRLFAYKGQNFQHEIDRIKYPVEQVIKRCLNDEITRYLVIISKKE
ncbi:MAG: 16S rRNA (guanine(527)-N(7))-methyltransferase RsmG [Christensenellaceae bacterium]|jgi:16S rRNA (guanine527-N7)-methyltransferase|nr:16S rRNA (guanine(527)-N(7))-methyltransferase RsmG [Christensenellaceae bacterium]